MYEELMRRLGVSTPDEFSAYVSPALSAQNQTRYGEGGSDPIHQMIMSDNPLLSNFGMRMRENMMVQNMKPQDAGTWVSMGNGMLFNNKTGETKVGYEQPAKADTIHTGPNGNQYVAPQGNVGQIDWNNPVAVKAAPTRQGEAALKEVTELMPSGEYHKVLVNPYTGQVVKDLGPVQASAADKKAAREAAQADANEIAALEAGYNVAMSITKEDVANVGGWSAMGGPLTPATRASYAKFQQLMGSEFMSAIQQMRGLGALSDREGQAALASRTKLGALLDPDSFIKGSEKDIQEEVDRLVALYTKGLRNMGVDVGATSQLGQGGGTNWRATDTGTKYRIVE